MKVIHNNTDITEYVLSFSWGGSQNEVSRKLEISVINSPNDPIIKPIDIKLSDRIYLIDDDGKTELFRGFVFDRERNSTTGSITYLAYDILFYTLKNFATYNFTGKTAEKITHIICDDMKIPVGSLARTDISQKLIVSEVSIYEIIMRAYTQAYERNGKMYCVTSSKDKLNVIEMGSEICDIKLSEDTNIINSSFSESIQNIVNRIKIYDESGNQTGVVDKTASIKKYGIFQNAYTKEDGKDAITIAKSMFADAERSVSVECLGYTKAVTGVGIQIKDTSTGLNGLFWINADTHKWENGNYTMSLTLTFKHIMDTKEG